MVIIRGQSEELGTPMPDAEYPIEALGLLDLTESALADIRRELARLNLFFITTIYDIENAGDPKAVCNDTARKIRSLLKKASSLNDTLASYLSVETKHIPIIKNAHERFDIQTSLISWEFQRYGKETSSLQVPSLESEKKIYDGVISKINANFDRINEINSMYPGSVMARSVKHLSRFEERKPPAVLKNPKDVQKVFNCMADEFWKIKEALSFLSIIFISTAWHLKEGWDESSAARKEAGIKIEASLKKLSMMDVTLKQFLASEKRPIPIKANAHEAFDKITNAINKQLKTYNREIKGTKFPNFDDEIKRHKELIARINANIDRINEINSYYPNAATIRHIKNLTV